MIIERRHKNSHFVKTTGKHLKLAFMSDLHWDNPKCDRKLLKKHLDRCKAEERYVILNGDTFCLMQGKYDPRRSKKDILPEHNVPNYLDAVIQDAVEWFAPYKDIILLMGYGNHETAIVKNVETDPLQRFVDLMNYTKGANIQIGGYGGWLTVQQKLFSTSDRTATTKVYYYHGSGGGGPVTKGTIQHQRQMADIQGADIITMGHVHELYTMVWSKKHLNKNLVPVHSKVYHLRTGTYKDEYTDGAMGWHVERGAPPKPLGCVAVDLDVDTIGSSDERIITPTIWAD